MEIKTVKQQELKRGLKNRHIQLIALGCAIGTGLFYGISDTISMAGPSVLLGYAIAGFIAFLIMRQLGEMIVEEPVAGSFSHFVYKYCGNFAGFISGWNYWMLYILVSMAELTAVGKTVHLWFPEIPVWVSVVAFFFLINAINLAAVKVYGEMEFWFAIIKVAAVISIIVFGAYLLFGGNTTGAGGEHASITNLWNDGGFFPFGGTGLIMAMTVIMFSFGGLELVGITAAEAENPEKVIPKATNQLIYRILIFYIGSLVVLMSLYPWSHIVALSKSDPNVSPFVGIFQMLNKDIVAYTFNFVILTALLSSYNSSVYANSRMLYGLAIQKNAPQTLLRVNRMGVPYISILASASVTAICVILNYKIPKEALSLLMSLVVSALVINWIMISWSQLRFRKVKDAEGVVPKFKAIFFPWGNYLCLVFLVGILVIMFIDDRFRTSVLMIPVWLAVLSVAYFIKQKVQAKDNA